MNDNTPRDIHGQPLQVGRWYWVRTRHNARAIACLQVVGLPSALAPPCVTTSVRDVWLPTTDWLPADGPPAWPGEAI